MNLSGNAKRNPDEIEVVGLGQASLDFLGPLPSFPAEDEKAELQSLDIQCGGPASTALVTLSRQGVATSFLGAISEDFFGREILKGLQDEGVDFSFLTIRPGFSSQFAFIAVNSSNANRTVFWHRGTTPPLSKHDVQLARFSRARILHLDGLMIEASLEAARQAREMGWKVVMDGGTVRDGTRELVSMVDVLIASQRFATQLAGPGAPIEKALQAMFRMGPQTAVVTLGANGSIGGEEGRIHFQSAFPVQAVDTTGAGDVYHGAYIYGLLQGWETRESMRFASAVAAMKCRRIGARNGIPKLEEINRFMQETRE